MHDVTVLRMAVRRTGLSQFYDDAEGIARVSVLYVDSVSRGQVIKQIDLDRSVAGGGWSAAHVIPSGLVDSIEEFMETDEFDEYWDEVQEQLWSEYTESNEP